MPDAVNRPGPKRWIDDSQRAFFEANGYLLVTELALAAELAALTEIYDRFFVSRDARRAGDLFDLAGTDEDGSVARLPQILAPQLYAPELDDTKLKRNATELVRDLLGSAATVRFAHAILKPPRDGAETPWHQDAAYWGPDFRYRAISIWVPLGDVAPENGCMEFVPGSHRLDVVDHISLANDPRIHALDLAPSARHHVQRVAPVPCRAGDAVLHTPYTLHHSGANTTDEPRRAIVLIGGLEPVPRPAPIAQPWMDEKRTLRQQRKDQAAAAEPQRDSS